MMPCELKTRVGIIGSGNFSRALAKRLKNAGYEVVIGSRRPRNLSEVDNCLCNVTMTSLEDCVKQVSIVFLAIHFENYKDCLSNHEDLFTGKTVVDVSNRLKLPKHRSNAEYLSSLLPNANIVKAFNVISAYAMENEFAGGSQEVFIAGDDLAARERVCVIARDMGFVASDWGLLQSARRIESYPLKIFPGWKTPILFTVGVFVVWFLYIIFIYFVKKTAYRWDQIFVKVLNKPLCMTAMTVYACTYLPSSFASAFQLYHGTKHINFPGWLNRWLLTRKQLGLIAFVLVCIHVIMSVLIMSPTYLSSWFQSTTIVIPGNRTDDIKIPIKTWMVWKGEAACLVGILAFVCMCIIAISTLPSVTRTLNWREWRFVQSKLGHVVLFLSICHVVIMGAPGWAKGGLIKTLQSITFLSLIIPFFTLFFKVIFSFPCIDKYVQKIRRGWEASYSKCRAKCSQKHATFGKVYSKPLDQDNISEEDMMIGSREEHLSCACQDTSIV
ncbi:metalloreductase STEAP4-like [Saccostrea echinata]|uniref:metalloreductase STEAP4-like n=1 Tax=Saccostrea echinata TaxID=191078 RepID=UPI002A81A2A5|nr:metalloreductase STEAP4-like [Saccostrea echinata]